MIAPQPIPRTLPRWQRIVALTMIGISTALIGGCTMDQSPDTSRRLTGEQKIQLIDSMRHKGSYEAARERLTATAQIIADRVSAAIPGQTWKFNEDPAGRKADREGLSCKELTGDIARRPIADAVIFGTAFSAEDFKVVTNIVREEAAKYGATTESSLFNESAKRDYDVQGNGYEFNLGQIKFATLNITGDCFLLQKVLDLPAGQLPPEPPIWPTTSTPH
ncbi:LppA family lipoprotein [Mycobacterium tuberculosis]|uniref:LppA family lipoprotein n=1 Tax=Mycobacterium tuberculosis TaxID=1773 RepID=UPI001D013C39|nr:LppA family lipoprotein [Mycobacterium tuberculosis]MCB5339877.1 LppA family lipoprotein [Mycobacterium tuberculosis variant bovis]